MPLYKFLGNRLLTFIQNRLLRTHFSELHCGYRAYSTKALADIPFQFNSDGFHFDTQIVIQFLLKNLRIKEVPVPTYYGDEIRYAKGLSYAWNVLRTTISVKLHLAHLFYKRRYDILGPQMSYPLKAGYPSSHTMAIDAVRPGARVLDVGCGEGFVGKALEEKGCHVAGIDEVTFAPYCLLDDFTQADLRSQNIPLSPDDFEFVLLLDIIEHLSTYDQYRILDDIRSRAEKQRPTLIITVPNVAFFVTRMQLLLGNFNYGKRGILDHTHCRLFTFKSIKSILGQSGYTIERIQGIPAPFPAAIGYSAISRFFLRLNQCLIRLLPGLFSYQIFVIARPLHTVQQLLGQTEAHTDRVVALQT
jgi:SAM-dependent methyltransferase